MARSIRPPGPRRVIRCGVATIRDEGVCVRHWEWSETSQTALILARRSGLLRVVAKGARRERGAFAGGLEILVRGELGTIIKESPRRDEHPLSILTFWDPRETFPQVRRSLDAHYAGTFMADLATRLVQEMDPHPGLYDALVSSLRALTRPAGIPRTVLSFQWSALREVGLSPDLGPPARGAYALFAPGAGRVVAAESDAPDGRVWRVRSATLALLREVAAGGGGRAGAGAEGAETHRRASHLLHEYGRYAIGANPPSYEFFAQGWARASGNRGGARR